jgi:hypothetical protein
MIIPKLSAKTLKWAIIQASFGGNLGSYCYLSRYLSAFDLAMAWRRANILA